MRRAAALMAFATLLGSTACTGASAQLWGAQASGRRPSAHSELDVDVAGGSTSRHPPRDGDEGPGEARGRVADEWPPDADGGELGSSGKRRHLTLSGHAARPSGAAPAELPSDMFRNTYYDFPEDDGSSGEVALFDASCRAIGLVTKKFHDEACVQGSGKLASGDTVSFAKRDCACASVCPRTSQKICFERLDRQRFPFGRGATGKPITPLYTVAVDSSVIPLGTALFIPEFVGIPRQNGSAHDGCFLAEDRGLKVTGRQIDVFTGSSAVRAAWNALVPTNRGVHVEAGGARCHTSP